MYMLFKYDGSSFVFFVVEKYNKSPKAQRRSPGYKVQRFNKYFEALSLTVAE